MKKTALITGISGQDGSFLAEFLLERGYRVCGLVRRSFSGRLAHLAALLDRVEWLPGDMGDSASLAAAVQTARPDEVYNLAAVSSIPACWESPASTSAVNALGVARLLEILRSALPSARFFQASSSEMFGAAEGASLVESTPLLPRNPYGVAKAYGHLLTVNYRESYGMFCASGILFNHHSPRCDPASPARLLARSAARIKMGLDDRMGFECPRIRMEWGWAPDHVRAAWLMLQQDRPEDYVVATGEPHTADEFRALVFEAAGLDARRFMEAPALPARPTDADLPAGDAGRARRRLKWEPSVTFPELARRMVEAELAVLRAEV